MTSFTTRSRWAAVGAAVAITLGAGGIGISHATTDSSSGPVSAFFPIEPCRLATNATILPDSSITLDGWGATGDCTLPNDITGLAANVTAVNASQQTNLRFYADGDPVPETANLNPSPGAAPTPNAVNITLSTANGKFRVYNRFGTVGVFIDIMGYYDDHTHDDRYYTETEVDAMMPRAAYAGGNQQVALSAADAVIRSVSLTAPADGRVIVESSGYVWLASGTDVIARCSLTTGTNVDAAAFQYVEIHSSGNASDVISGTRGYEVTAGQTLTVNLVCDEFSGQANVSDTWIAATFFPT